MNMKDSLFRGDFGQLSVEVKEMDKDGEFEGYGSVFNVVDQGSDIVLPGAFTQSLVSYPAEKVKMLWQHTPSEVIGKWIEMREDDRGLYVHGRLLQSIRKGKEAYELLKEGIIEGLSMGYRTKEYEIDRELGVRKLKRVDLREVSVVTFPMNERSLIQRVKSGVFPTEREFEQMLTRDAGFSAQQAKAIVANGYKSILSERDAGSDDAGFNEALREAAAKMRTAAKPC